MRRKICTGPVLGFALQPGRVSLGILVLFFLGGSVFGWYSGAYSAAVYAGELSGYFLDFMAAASGSWSFEPGYTFLCYLGFPAVLFLLGFSLLGTFLIPLCAGVFGYVTVFAISALSGTFGAAGVHLSFALMAVRLLFTLPCFFLLAQQAWPLSFDLVRLSLGRGKRTRSSLCAGSYLVIFLCCVVVLLAGILAERLVTPLLIRLLWEG